MNKKPFRFVLRRSLLPTLIASISAPAIAEIEEVVVTASKRAETLQEVPMSITAITGDSLERFGTADFTDCLLYTSDAADD